MNKYRVEVFFTGSQVIEIEAESKSEAVNKAFMEVDDPQTMEVDDYEVECLDGDDEYFEDDDE